MEKFKIFVVDDDDWYREYISYTLSLVPEYEVSVFSDGAGFLRALNEEPDVVTLDFRLPDTDGARLLAKVKEQSPETEVVIISEQDKIETAVELLKSGAYDYLVKSKDMRDRLFITMQHLLKNRQLRNRISLLEKEIGRKYDLGKNLVGKSESFTKVFQLIERAAKSPINVMISGETGTGKEEVAKAIHFNSNYSNGPFTAVNVAAIPKELVESELFGHEKGAFTGAIQSRAGKLEEAGKGTLFLDEIGEFDLALQAKLLRALQEREFTRLGSNKPVKLQSRLIVATHKNLVEEVKAGRFRDDLYYRLFGLQIQLPPLRERGNDIILLAKYFIENYCRENKIPLKTLSESAKHKLLSYPFPGNVRELKSLVELAVVMSDEGIIEDTHLLPGGQDILSELLSEELTLEEYNKKIIFHFLEKYDHNVILTAKKLGIGKTTIYSLLKANKNKDSD